MRKQYYVWFIASLVVISVHGQIECETVWGGALSVIPPDRINDGYCDCTNGADETTTEACAGLSAWAGLGIVWNDPKRTTPISFTCPQQPDMSIPMSRINDGICDCCDGADESIGDCSDDCAVILAQQAARRVELQNKFIAGSAERKKMLEEYVQFQIQTNKDIEQVTKDLETKRQQLDEALVKLDTVETEYVLAHVRRVESVMDNDYLVKGLTVEELQWLIIHACQMAGEMESAEEAKTCIPLRLAALQIGSSWEPGTYAFRHRQNISSFADILYHNSQDTDNLLWNPEKLKGDKRGRRRLTRVVAAEENADEYGDDDDMPHDDEDEDDEDDYRDDSYDADRGKRYEHDSSKSSDDAPKDNEKRQELINLINQQRFSKSRVAMVDKATALLEKIEKLMKESEAESNNEEEGGEEKEETQESDKDEASSSKVEESKVEGEETKATNFDPMAMPMLKSQLEKRKKTIQRGLDYAVSGKVLLDAVTAAVSGDELEGLLRRLALGTLNHGKLTTAQFYEILAAIVPGLENAIADPQTCQPRSEICPPRAIERDFRVPPISVSERMEVFCAQALTAEAPSGVCVASDAYTSTMNDEIPSNVSDGYYGYYVVAPRGDDDLFYHLFQSMGFSAKGKEELEIEGTYVDIKEKVNNLEKEVDVLTKKLDKLENSLADPEKYGPDGELHAIADKCFEVEEGKYVYEVCMFKNAYQKDKGSSSQGTDLGRWQGTATETVTNEQGVEYQRRVWKWDNGAKCWNGPVRSITAYVDCGAETKVLSADEPDTCRYVLEMQSPVACDADFQNRHGLFT